MRRVRYRSTVAAFDGRGPFINGLQSKAVQTDDDSDTGERGGNKLILYSCKEERKEGRGEQVMKRREGENIVTEIYDKKLNFKKMQRNVTAILIGVDTIMRCVET